MYVFSLCTCCKTLRLSVFDKELLTYSNLNFFYNFPGENPHLFWHSSGVRKTSARFGGKIWKLAAPDGSVAAFNTALSRFRFLLEYPVSSSPMLAISHYGRPSRFVLIPFNARRLYYSASLLVPHNLESWISHPKESELHLTCFVVSLS